MSSGMVVAVGVLAIVAVLALVLALRARPGSDLVLLQQQIEALRRQSADSAQSQTQLVTDRLLRLSADVNRQLETVGQRVQESQKSVGIGWRALPAWWARSKKVWAPWARRPREYLRSARTFRAFRTF
ncbi:MAG: hypothetical protein IPP35_10485 [Elusimicrobia bacterium]|nr:hypothetical protein [Elusimicrobiota bacterium]